MKKIMTLAIILGAFSMTSCKKEYTCVCTVSGTSTEVKSGSKLTKSQAKTWCETSSSLAGVSCSLK